MTTCLTFDDVSLDYLTLKEIQNFLNYLNKLEVNATLFVVPNRTRNCNNLEINEFAICLRNASDSGHEVAQHGNYHSGNEFFSEFGCLLPLPYPNYDEQIKRMKQGMTELKRLSGISPKGFRAPYYLHNKTTLSVLSDLGFMYDSSKTMFKPAHANRWRLQTLSRLIPFRVKGILEVPVTADYSFGLNEIGVDKSIEQALRDFELVRSQGGVFVLNNHPNKIDLKVLFFFLRSLILKLSHRSDFVRLEDVARSHEKF